MKSLLWFILGCLLGFCVSSYLHEGCGWKLDYGTDTMVIVKTDTIRDTLPIPYETKVIETKYVKLRVDNVIRDTLTMTDTAYVELPISQTAYRDSLYTAWVSGYEAKLDSIEVYPTERIITIAERIKPKRWGVGVQAGVGIGAKGFTPYLGIGVSYNLVCF